MSNGDTICDLPGVFKNLTVGAGAGTFVSADGFKGSGQYGQPVSGGGFSLGEGIGGSLFGGETDTFLFPASINILSHL